MHVLLNMRSGTLFVCMYVCKVCKRKFFLLNSYYIPLEQIGEQEKRPN